MQRVRIGLTGLAFVFVVVLLAAVLINPSEEKAITAKTLEQQRRPENAAAAAIAVETEPKEPLAELGMTPGNVDENSVEPVPSAEAPPPAPRQ